jgi:signal transduction histidine kinase
MTPSRRIWLLNGGLAAATVGLFVGVVQGLPAADTSVRVPWWALAAAFYVAEVWVVHIQFRREAYSFSLSEIPLVMGLFFVSPEGLVLAQLVGAAAALIVHRRQSPLKLVFNLGHFCLEATLAVIVFHAVGGTADPIGPAGWIGAFLATVVVTLVGAITITAAISLAERGVQFQMFTRGVSFGALVGLANTCLALVGTHLLETDPRSAWLLAVPAAVLFVAYRAYTAQREKNESLAFLYESTRMVHGSLQVDAAVLALLSQAREMFRAEISEVTLLPESDGEAAVRTVLGPGERKEVMRRVELDPTAGVWARVASEGQAILLARPIANERLRSHYSALGITDAIVAPLYGGGRIIGMMTVANRLGDVSTFDEEDLKLFETLANHAGVSLENARLVQRLEESLAHLTEMNRLKDDFVATVSHELRTPLTSIQGCVKTLLDPAIQLSDREESDLLEAASRQSDRLRHLIEDLLVVSRIEADQTPAAQITGFSVDGLVRRVAEEFTARAGARKLDVRCEDGLPRVHNDEGKVHQIVSNLVDNGVKYSPPDGTVRLTARTRDEGLVVTVEDDGPGIPPDAQEEIFGRFYQVDQSVTKLVGGMGLGLYICRRLAEAIGGRVWLEHSDERGSAFSLWFPTDIRGTGLDVAPAVTAENPD